MTMTPTPTIVKVHHQGLFALLKLLQAAGTCPTGQLLCRAWDFAEFLALRVHLPFSTSTSSAFPYHQQQQQQQQQEEQQQQQETRGGRQRGGRRGVSSSSYASSSLSSSVSASVSVSASSASAAATILSVSSSQKRLHEQRELLGGLLVWIHRDVLMRSGWEVGQEEQEGEEEEQEGEEQQQQSSSSSSSSSRYSSSTTSSSRRPTAQEERQQQPSEPSPSSSSNTEEGNATTYTCPPRLQTFHTDNYTQQYSHSYHHQWHHHHLNDEFLFHPLHPSRIYQIRNPDETGTRKNLIEPYHIGACRTNLVLHIAYFLDTYIFPDYGGLEKRFSMKQREVVKKEKEKEEEEEEDEAPYHHRGRVRWDRTWRSRRRRRRERRREKRNRDVVSEGDGVLARHTGFGRRKEGGNDEKTEVEGEEEEEPDEESLPPPPPLESLPQKRILGRFGFEPIRNPEAYCEFLKKVVVGFPSDFASRLRRRLSSPLPHHHLSSSSSSTSDNDSVGIGVFSSENEAMRTEESIDEKGLVISSDHHIDLPLCSVFLEGSLYESERGPIVEVPPISDLAWCHCFCFLSLRRLFVLMQVSRKFYEMINGPLDGSRPRTGTNSSTSGTSSTSIEEEEETQQGSETDSVDVVDVDDRSDDDDDDNAVSPDIPAEDFAAPDPDPRIDEDTTLSDDENPATGDDSEDSEKGKEDYPSTPSSILEARSPIFWKNYYYSRFHSLLDSRSILSHNKETKRWSLEKMLRVNVEIVRDPTKAVEMYVSLEDEGKEASRSETRRLKDFLFDGYEVRYWKNLFKHDWFLGKYQNQISVLRQQLRDRRMRLTAKCAVVTPPEDEEDEEEEKEEEAHRYVQVVCPLFRILSVLLKRFAADLRVVRPFSPGPRITEEGFRRDIGLVAYSSSQVDIIIELIIPHVKNCLCGSLTFLEQLGALQLLWRLAEYLYELCVLEDGAGVRVDDVLIQKFERLIDPLMDLDVYRAMYYLMINARDLVYREYGQYFGKFRNPEYAEKSIYDLSAPSVFFGKTFGERVLNSSDLKDIFENRTTGTTGNNNNGGGEENDSTIRSLGLSGIAGKVQIRALKFFHHMLRLRFERTFSFLLNDCRFFTDIELVLRSFVGNLFCELHYPKTITSMYVLAMPTELGMNALLDNHRFRECFVRYACATIRTPDPFSGLIPPELAASDRVRKRMSLLFRSSPIFMVLGSRCPRPQDGEYEEFEEEQGEDEEEEEEEEGEEVEMEGVVEVEEETSIEEGGGGGGFEDRFYERLGRFLDDRRASEDSVQVQLKSLMTVPRVDRIQMVTVLCGIARSFTHREEFDSSIQAWRAAWYFVGLAGEHELDSMPISEAGIINELANAFRLLYRSGKTGGMYQIYLWAETKLTELVVDVETPVADLGDKEELVMVREFGMFQGMWRQTYRLGLEWKSDCSESLLGEHSRFLYPLPYVGQLGRALNWEMERAKSESEDTFDVHLRNV